MLCRAPHKLILQKHSSLLPLSNKLERSCRSLSFSTRLKKNKILYRLNKKISSIVLNIYTPIIIIAYLCSIPAMIKLLEKTGQFLIEDGKGNGEGIVIKNYDFYKGGYPFDI